MAQSTSAEDGPPSAPLGASGPPTPCVERPLGAAACVLMDRGGAAAPSARFKAALGGALGAGEEVHDLVATGSRPALEPSVASAELGARRGRSGPVAQEKGASLIGC